MASSNDNGKKGSQGSRRIISDVMARDQANEALLDLMKAQETMLSSKQPQAKGSSTETSGTAPAKPK